MAKVQVMYDLARLAFETDSTRAITLMLNSVGTPVVQIDGATITDSYHNLSHHGMAEEKLTQLKVIDEWHMKLLADLFEGLKSAQEGGETLLDRTMVLYGSQPRRRERALDDEPADALRRRRLPARPAPGLRRGAQLPAAEPVRLDAPADGDRGGQVRLFDGHDARARNRRHESRSARLEDAARPYLRLQPGSHPRRHRRRRDSSADLGSGHRPMRPRARRPHPPHLGSGLGSRSRILTGAWDNTARLWNAESRECLQVLEGHSGFVRSVAFSDDGRLAITGSGDNTVRVWELGSGTCLAVLNGHTDDAYCALLTPDCREAISGSRDGTVRVWDVATGSEIRRMEAHPSHVQCLAWRPAANVRRSPARAKSACGRSTPAVACRSSPAIATPSAMWNGAPMDNASSLPRTIVL